MLPFNNTIESIPPSGIRKFFDLVLESKDIISLGVGEPDFATPWHIREKAFSSLEQGYTSYTSNWGITELRDEISLYLKKRFNAKFKGSEILITNGVSEGVDLALRTILNNGDEVIIPEPIYVCYKPLATLAGGVAVPISNKSLKITAADIEKAITKKTKVIILCYPSNPTGYTMDEAEIRKVAKIAIKNNIWIISDEIYAELTYDNKKHFSMGAIAEIKENLILLSGFSKAWAMTGWRIGYIAAGKRFLEQAVKIHQYSALCAPIMSQHAALEALQKGLPEVEKMKKSFWQRRNFMYKSLNEIGLKVNKPEGALYIFPSIKKYGLTSEEFAMGLLKEQKVAAVPGTAFGDSGEGYLRMCYAVDFNLLKESIKRIKLFTDNLKK